MATIPPSTEGPADPAGVCPPPPAHQGKGPCLGLSLGKRAEEAALLLTNETAPLHDSKAGEVHRDSLGQPGPTGLPELAPSLSTEDAMSQDSCHSCCLMETGSLEDESAHPFPGAAPHDPQGAHAPHAPQEVLTTQGVPVPRSSRVLSPGSPLSPQLSADLKRQRVCGGCPGAEDGGHCGAHSLGQALDAVHASLAASLDKDVAGVAPSSAPEECSAAAARGVLLNICSPGAARGMLLEGCSPAPEAQGESIRGTGCPSVPGQGQCQAEPHQQQQQSHQQQQQQQPHQQQQQQYEQHQKQQQQHQRSKDDARAGAGAPMRPGRQQRKDLHRASMEGDVAAMLELLRGSPGDINARNSATWQTPLHVAASGGKVSPVELLLGWQGPEKASLEAKNTFGETPLHVAAKSGHADVTRCILDAGACISAQASNGMTALHLAVWAAGRAGGTAVARVLLEGGADLGAKDKAGHTPPDLADPGNGPLLLLLREAALARQLAQAPQASPPPAQVLAELEAELAWMVGVAAVKQQLRRWAKGMLLDRTRRALGIPVAPTQAPHMAFLGNPGTGKTSVARALARLLHRVGVIPSPKLVEVQRTDLVGEFVGHTGPKTRAVISRARGGVLFVDEAYRLVPAFKSEEKDYGLEALEEIMAAMDGGDMVVILAGYSGPMQRTLDANEGLRRRISRVFQFQDLSCQEIAQLMALKMQQSGPSAPAAASAASAASAGGAPAPTGAAGGAAEGAEGRQPWGCPRALAGFRLHEECTVESLSSLVQSVTTVEQRQQCNGALAEGALVGAREALDARLDLGCRDATQLSTIRLRDVAQGLAALP